MEDIKRQFLRRRDPKAYREWLRDAYNDCAFGRSLSYADRLAELPDCPKHSHRSYGAIGKGYPPLAAVPNKKGKLELQCQVRNCKFSAPGKNIPFLVVTAFNPNPHRFRQEALAMFAKNDPLGLAKAMRLDLGAVEAKYTYVTEVDAILAMAHKCYNAVTLEDTIVTVFGQWFDGCTG